MTGGLPPRKGCGVLQLCPRSHCHPFWQAIWAAFCHVLTGFWAASGAEGAFLSQSHGFSLSRAEPGTTPPELAPETPPGLDPSPMGRSVAGTTPPELAPEMPPDNGPPFSSDFAGPVLPIRGLFGSGAGLRLAAPGSARGGGRARRGSAPEAPDPEDDSKLWLAFRALARPGMTSYVGVADLLLPVLLLAYTWGTPSLLATACGSAGDAAVEAGAASMRSAED